MKKDTESKWSYGSMCGKGRACVENKLRQGETAFRSVRECWKKAKIGVRGGGQDLQ